MVKNCEVLSPGLYSSFQDSGRNGYLHLGIPISGAMDMAAHQCANQILCNNVKCTTIECTLIGPKLKFRNPTFISIAGADIDAFVNEIPVALHKAIAIQAGDVLSFGKLKSGCRFYIAVLGGWNAESWMGSTSVALSAGVGNRLIKGDWISYPLEGIAPSLVIDIKYHTENPTIQVEQGPEYFILSDYQKEILKDCLFTILPSSNRMAYNVEPSPGLQHKASVVSSGVLPGTVQLTPAGGLIFLMRDAQTTGGYPRVLIMTNQGINNLAQMKAGEKIRIEIQRFEN